MARSRINYSEPLNSGSDLEISEIIAGSRLRKKENLKAIIDDRYNSKLFFNPLDMYQVTGINFNLKSTVAQLGFFPEFAEKKKDDLIKLTFTPNIKDLKYDGKFDFYSGKRFGGNELYDFPFGALFGMEEKTISGYNGTFDALAIGGNGRKDLLDKEIGKNFYTADRRELYTSEETDAFYVIILGRDLRHISTLKYKKAEHPLYKMSFFYGNMYLINYDLHKHKLAIRKNDNTIFSINLKAREDIKFFRTYKYDLIYSDSRFILLEKANGKITHKEISETFDNISFNPVLKTVCLEKDNYYKVYKFFSKKMNLIHDRQLLNPTIIKYAVQWVGNLEFDYMIQDTFGKPKLSEYVDELGYRGHYLWNFGEYEADFEVGVFQKQILTGLGAKGDFHINNTDDADIGIDEYLFNRREAMPHEAIKLTRTSYVRMYHTARQIVFYSTDFHNNFGELHLFSY